MDSLSGGVDDAASIVAENAATYDDQAEAHVDRLELQRPELALLRRFRGRWDSLAVLDVGVGAGRTSHTLAAVAGSYVGVDLSARMIELARAAVPEDERTSFVVGDARDLSFLGDRRFGLVLFSFNGIDYVGHEDRLRILRELRARTAADGLCAFSSHSLRALPLAAPKLRRPSPYAPLRTTADLVDDLRRRRVIRQVNDETDIAAARRRGWALIRDEHRSLVTYYVDPETQRRQLQAAGLELVETLDRSGRPLGAELSSRDVWLHYVCRPSAAA